MGKSAVSSPGRDGGPWLRVMLIEVEKQSGCVTGRAEKQLIDVTEKYKGVQDNVRVYAQVMGRLELHLGEMRRTREGVVV